MFLGSNRKGSDYSTVNHRKMWLLAESEPMLSNEYLDKIAKKHFEFLCNGGAGGEWKRLEVRGLVIGFYDWKKINNGEQAVFEMKNLNNISFEKREFPFANFCGSFSRNSNFQFANLSHCLFTDVNMENADFTGANLKNVDFSRSNLKGAKFVNAELLGADFENCDLVEADFTGAKIGTAQFPGANLKKVIV